MKCSIAVNQFAFDKMPKAEVGRINGLFENAELTAQDMEHVVKSGFSFVCGELRKDETNYSFRHTRNFVKSNVVGIDIDNKNGYISLDKLFARNDVMQNLWFVYTTASHTLQHHKFRLLFRLPEYVGLEQHSLITRKLIEWFGGACDSSCKDSVRMYFGSSKGNPWAVGNTMSAYFLNTILAYKAPATMEKKAVVTKPKIQKRTGFKEWTIDDIRAALIMIRAYWLGYRETEPFCYFDVKGYLKDWTKLINSLWSKYGDTITSTIKEIFPPNPSCKDEYERKYNSRLRDVGFGTFVHFAKQAGFDMSKYVFRGK